MSRFSLVGIALLVIAGSVEAQIVSYDFNKIEGGPPTGSISSGSSKLMEVNKSMDPAMKSETYRSKDGEGVTGQPGDYALDFRNATGMGNLGTGAAAFVVNGNVALSELKSITFCGWFKVEEPIGGAARLFEMMDNSSQGFFLACSDNTLTLELNRVRASGKGLDYSAIGKWVFFAVAFNGTEISQNVTFYMGTAADGLNSQVKNMQVPDPLPAKANALTMGNSGGFQRPVKGLLDNFEIYGSAVDGSGCLDETKIKEIFQAVVDKMKPADGAATPAAAAP